MTPEWFVDTSFVVASISTKDQHHHRAVQLGAGLRRAGARLVTTAAVLLEVGNFLAKRHARHDAVRTIVSLQRDPSCQIVPLDPTLFDRGFQLFQQRPDKEWSLVDCISFVVMAERGITEALSSDEHFEQAGFVALLRH